MKHLGLNAFIYPTAKIIHPENLSLGDESIIADFSFIYAVGKGIEIGNFCNITEHAIIQSGPNSIVKFHDFSAIGPRVTILAASDNYLGEAFSGLSIYKDKYRKIISKDVILKSHVQVGTCSTILPGVTLGEGCQIGANSLVTKSMPEWTLCYGSPCKPVKEIPRETILSMKKEFLEEYYV